MTSTLTCSDVDGSGIVERYVADRLDPEELERFEQHLFECDRCRDEVALAVGVRRALREPLAENAARTGWGRWWVAAAGLAAAAMAALVLLPTGDAVDVRRFGAVSQPPLYVGAAVRGSPAPADSVFEAAMTAYRAGAYGEAIRGLRDALDAGMPPAPARFFLGSSLLMQGQAEAAARAFDHVVGLGESPYLPEAHYYRAKALLRLGRRDDALDELRRAEAKGGRISRRAAALADSIGAASDS